eukprot:jgi/Tetstr1/423502/TSEL_014179.t2
MRLPLGTAITVRFGDLTDAAKKVWVAAHPGEPVAGVTLRGVVCGHSGAWHRVTFAKDHPEIEREVSLNAAALVPPAPAAAPAEHRRVGPTTFDLEEVQAANQQLLDAFADADAEPAGDPPNPTNIPRHQPLAPPPPSFRRLTGNPPLATAVSVFLAVLLAMTLHSTVSLEELWDNHAVPSIKALPTRYGFAALMTQRRFNEWRAYFRFWGDPGDLPDSQYSETCQDWVEALNDYCDAITPPVERLKSKYKDGRVHKYRYEVEQRESHATYRQHFNAVDINNKLSVGPHSVATGWGPHSAVLRFWLYTVAVAESNAYLCYTSFTNNKDMTRHEWKCAMADALVAEGRAEMMGSASGLHSTSPVPRSRATTRSSKSSHCSAPSPFDTETGDGPSGVPRAFDEGWHTKGTKLTATMYSAPNPENTPSKFKDGKERAKHRQCVECRRNLVRSICSGCGAPVCSSLCTRPCFAMHVAAHLHADGWAKIGPANPSTINTNRVLDM